MAITDYRNMKLTFLFLLLMLPSLIPESSVPNTVQITPAVIKQEIIRQSKLYQINITTSLAIAHCESRFNHLAKNKHSTASGVYQFLSGTFRNYCSGEVFNYQDNIQCFMQQYPRHSGWWHQCS